MIPDDGRAAGIVRAAWDAIRHGFPFVGAAISTVNHSDVRLELRMGERCVRTTIPSGMLAGRGEPWARTVAEGELWHGVSLLLRPFVRKPPEG